MCVFAKKRYKNAICRTLKATKNFVGFEYFCNKIFIKNIEQMFQKFVSNKVVKSILKTIHIA